MRDHGPTFNRHVIKEARLARDWSIEELAVASGLSYTGLFHLESGYRKPKAETLMAVCRALGLEVEQCFEPAVPA